MLYESDSQSGLVQYKKLVEHKINYNTCKQIANIDHHKVHLFREIEGQGTFNKSMMRFIYRQFGEQLPQKGKKKQ